MPSDDTLNKYRLILLCICRWCVSLMPCKRWWLSVWSARLKSLCNPWTWWIEAITFLFLIVNMKIEDVGESRLHLFFFFFVTRTCVLSLKKKLDICLFSPRLSSSGGNTSTWECPVASEVEPGRDVGEVEWGGFIPFWRNGRGGHWHSVWSHGLVRRMGPVETGPPSGVCHWISLTPWWETRRLYNVSLLLFLFPCVTDLGLMKPCSRPLSSVLISLSLYISVWSEDRRESAVGLCTVSC